MPIAVARYIAMVTKIDRVDRVVCKLPFTPLAKVCYIARNAVTIALTIWWEPGRRFH